MTYPKLLSCYTHRVICAFKCVIGPLSYKQMINGEHDVIHACIESNGKLEPTGVKRKGDDVVS